MEERGVSVADASRTRVCAKKYPPPPWIFARKRADRDANARAGRDGRAIRRVGSDENDDTSRGVRREAGKTHL